MSGNCHFFSRRLYTALLWRFSLLICWGCGFGASALKADSTNHYIMPLGDSITDGFWINGGYRVPLYQMLTNGGYSFMFVGTATNSGFYPTNIPTGLSPDYVHHDGHSGWTIEQISASFVTNFMASIPVKPDIILLNIGANNYKEDGAIVGNPTNTLDQLIQLIATNQPGASIIVADVCTRLNNPPARTNIETQFLPFVPGIVARHAALGQKVYFQGMYNYLQLSDFVEGTHPNQTGYSKMAERWYFAIQSVAPLKPRLSIKFAADQNSGSDAINNTWGAGVLNTTNWFNLAGSNSGSNGVSRVPFYTTSGGFANTSCATLVYNYVGENSQINHAGVSLTNNVALLNSYVVAPNNGWYLSVTNLDPVFTKGYNVYLYFQGTNNAGNQGGQNYLKYYAGQTVNSSVLGTRQWNLFSTVATNVGSFVKDTTPANASAADETAGANYCLFTNLSGGAFDLMITNGNAAGINAIEIMPLATTASLLNGATNGMPFFMATNPVLRSAAVSLIDQVSPVPPDGQPVVFMDGATILGTNVLTGGLAAFTTSTLSVGNHNLTAVYGGDANFLASTSSVLTVIVTVPTLSAPVTLPATNPYVGGRVTLVCSDYTGLPPYSFQWQAGANGTSYTNVSGATTNQLTLANVTTNTAGYYRLVFTAANGSVTSAPVQLTVQTFYISPAAALPSSTLFSGQSAVLVCSNYTGLGSYGFQWQACADGVHYTNVTGATASQMQLLGVTTNSAGYYQCAFTAANGSVTSAPVQLKVLVAGGAAARLAIKFAPDQNYQHNFINLNWTTAAAKQPAGVLNTTNWNNWNTSGFSSPYVTNKFFYDVKGSTNGNLSSATIIDYHYSEQTIYYNGTWPAAVFTNNNALLLNSTFWYSGDQVACQVTNLDPVFAATGYSVYVYFLSPNVGCGQQFCLANFAGLTTNSSVVSNRMCSLFTTTNWNSFNSGAYLTNLPSFLKGTPIFTPGVQTTNTVRGSYPAWETAGANYVVFSNCPPSGAFSIAVSNTYYAGICGIEIVQGGSGSGLAPATSTLTASTNSMFLGGTVTFTNLVSPAPADGEYVIFMDGATLLGLGSLSGGKSAYSATSLSAGTHSITAVYGGDGAYLASTSSVATVTVVALPTLSAAVAIPSTNVYAGMTVTLVCSNFTGAPPYGFQWQVSGDGSSYTNMPGATTNQVTLPAVPAGNGDYRLVFTAGGLSVTSSVVPLTVNPPAAVNAQQAEGSLVLSWPQGVLLQATNVSGPWTTNSAASPFTNQTDTPRMFYRVQFQ